MAQTVARSQTQARFIQMKRVVWFVIGVGVVLLAAPALATERPPHNRPPDNRPPDRGGSSDATAAATATSSSTSTATGGDAVATAAGGAAQASNQLDQTINQSQSLITINGNNQPAAQGQKLLTPNSTGAQNDGGEATGDISVLSPSTSVTIENPDDIKIRNVPSMVAPDIFPTTSCFKGASGSLAVTGFGISGGAGSIDEGCVEREEIRLAHAMGMTQRALYRWCHLPNNVERFGTAADCMTFDPVGEQVVQRFNTLSSGFVTESRLEQADAQIIEQVKELTDNANQAIEQLQARLDANAAAARREAQEEAEWKAKIAKTYLTESAQE